MQFTKLLREPIKRGEVTCTIRIWRQPRVKVGNRYRLDEAYIVVERIVQITLDDITGQLARRCGFLGTADLLKVAKHGRGDNVYLIHSHYQGGAIND